MLKAKTLLKSFIYCYFFVCVCVCVCVCVRERGLIETNINKCCIIIAHVN